MANSYLTNIHTRKIIAENVIFHNLRAKMYNEKTCPQRKNSYSKLTVETLQQGVKYVRS